MSQQIQFEMDRRSLLQHAAMLLGSTVVLGACTTLPEAAAATDGPFALTDAQRATLSALADTLMPATDTPGALAAGVPANVERLMQAWASAETRTEMLAALDRVEALGGGFTGLSPAARHDVLVPHDADALVVTAPAGSGIAALISGPRRRDQGYSVTRELVLVLYYYSEIGLTQELQWTPIPGRWDPSVPLTPTSRAISNGVGLN